MDDSTTLEPAATANNHDVCQSPSTGPILQSNNVYVTELRPFDVLFGRGMTINKSPGNFHYRELITSRRYQYLKTSNRSLKNELARDVYSIITEKGGRFLRESKGDSAVIKSNEALGSQTASGTTKPTNPGVWIEVDTETALLKIKHALRERYPSLEATPTVQMTQNHSSVIDDTAATNPVYLPTIVNQTISNPLTNPVEPVGAVVDTSNIAETSHLLRGLSSNSEYQNFSLLESLAGHPYVRQQASRSNIVQPFRPTINLLHLAIRQILMANNLQTSQSLQQIYGAGVEGQGGNIRVTLVSQATNNRATIMLLQRRLNDMIDLQPTLIRQQQPQQLLLFEADSSVQNLLAVHNRLREYLRSLVMPCPLHNTQSNSNNTIASAATNQQAREWMLLQLQQHQQQTNQNPPFQSSARSGFWFPFNTEGFNNNNNTTYR